VSDQVQGYCPMGCGATLFLGAGGYVTCSWSKCPRPDAASDILLEREHEHVVTFADDGTFSIKHPLRERLDDALLTCPLTAFLARLDFPPVKAGNYRATQTTAFGWTWTPINTDGCPNAKASPSSTAAPCTAKRADHRSNSRHPPRSQKEINDGPEQRPALPLARSRPTRGRQGRR
jgi:hypothetical protein